MNATIGWICVTLGFLSGAVIGFRFDQPDWLGGYSALPRRLIRLGHIALVALGALNVLYALCLPGLRLSHVQAQVAGVAWAVGALAMPLSCFASAWRPAAKPMFVVPVVALVTAALLTLFGQVQT